MNASYAAQSERTTLLVIGGGITGLAAAVHVQSLAPQARLVLLEAGCRVGGLLQTHRQDGFVMEEAAENFLMHGPWAADLCRRIGFGEQLQATDPRRRGALVMRRGRLQTVPPGFAMLAPTRIWPILTSRVLSLWGKLRLAWEPFVPARRDSADESIAAFARRRLGREAFERLIEPLVGSIFGLDPEQLSLQATLPHLAQMERASGSLWLAQRRPMKRSHVDGEGSSATSDPFATPRDGMSSLVAALATHLGSAIELDSPVERLHRDGGDRWLVDVGGPAPRRIVADGIVLAAPAPRCERILRELDGPLADELSQIDYRDVTLAAVAYRREQVGHSLNSHGIVIPRRENSRLHSVSFSSIKYPDRAPAGSVLLRASLRQDGATSLSDLSDEQLQTLVTQELATMLGVRGRPLSIHLVRHRLAMPNYRLGHPQRLLRLKQRLTLHRGLALAGAAFGGSGVPQCIRSGEQAAQNVVAQLAGGCAQPNNPAAP